MTGRKLTRRIFLKSALAAAGLAPGASSLAKRRGVPSHRGATAADSSRRDERVLIIGAGMAGLAAANELRALASMYGVIPPPVDALITRWRSDPWARGSYSYVPPGSSYQRYAALGEPIGGKLFFAGEATHVEFPSTVHGAFLSGIRAARQLAALPARGGEGDV